MDAPHAFRKGWPRKKRRLGRVHRRQSDLEVAAVLRAGDPEEVLVLEQPVRGKLEKSGVRSLGKAVQEKRTRQVEGILPHLAQYWGDEYDPQTHRVPFARFLDGLFEGRKGMSVHHAEYLHRLLDAPHLHD